MSLTPGIRIVGWGEGVRAGHHGVAVRVLREGGYPRAVDVHPTPLPKTPDRRYPLALSRFHETYINRLIIVYTCSIFCGY
jgi:hypothetical protein